jgi:DNA replication protein DnaC
MAELEKVEAEAAPWDRVAAKVSSDTSRKDQDQPRPDPIRSALAQVGVNVRKYVDADPATLDAFDPNPDGQALEAARKFVASFLSGQRPSLYLFSRRPGERLAPGNGKTMLAVAIIREILTALPLSRRPGEGAVPSNGLTIRFAYVPEIVDDYRRQFDESAQPENLDQKYLWPELLVMDDIGAQRLTDYAIETLNRIIYRREARSTIYTSNLDLEQIEDKDPSGYIERATSRIAGECRIVCLTGRDRRLLRAS